MSNTNKPTPHPHAKLIKAWAANSSLPIQCKGRDGKWYDEPYPIWNIDSEYRIKPEENEPWKPKKDEIYFFVCQRADGSFGVGEYHWSGNAEDNNLFGNNNCFRTREEAKAAVELVKDALKIQQRVIGTLDNLEKIAKNLPPIDIVNKGKLVERVESMKKDELKISAPSDENFQLDGKPLTDGEKEMIRLHREHVENASQGWRKQWEFLTDGEAALIRALRKVVICKVYDKDVMVVHNGDNGIRGVKHPVAFLTNNLLEIDEPIRVSLKQIKAEQKKNND